MKKADVLKFVKSQNLAVVATVNSIGIPQAAVLEFGELDDFTIIVDTLKTSRKYKNLQMNQNVAVVIGWEDVTVQIDGVASELEGKKLAVAKKSYFTKNSDAEKWQNISGVAYFAIKPVWLRYSDLSKEPWLVEEFDLAT